MSVVVDTSAVVELLLGRSHGRAVSEAIGEQELFAPELLALEVLSVLRRLVLNDALSADRAELALQDLNDLQIRWIPMFELMDRAWQLRESVSAYDAMFLVAADAVGGRVITCDARLSRAAPGLTIPVP